MADTSGFSEPTQPLEKTTEGMDNDNVTAVWESLKDPGQVRLFDEIDKLRNMGVEQQVALPQLIVCGDTSAGKSSVLEAISTVPFPRKDTVCTRFAIEISLRSCPDIGASATIRPSPHNTDETRKRALERFVKTGCELSEVSELIEQAAQVIGLSESMAFSDDVLELHMFGSNLPSLTLVDLPGIIHTSKNPGDLTKVHNMVEHYMRKPRSVILAVIAASNDVVNQVVVEKAKKHDPNGDRTMGIITKLDTLPANSGSRAEYLRIARNEKDGFRFRLGWHVLRNAGPDDLAQDGFDRDDAEATFFARPLFNSLLPDTKGIKSLRKRLSKVLFEQICRELPNLIEELNAKLQQCRTALAQLGDARDSKEQQKKFLHNIASQYRDRTTRALEGNYSHGMHLDLNSDMDPKRLRAIVQTHIQAFADDMEEHGHSHNISTDSSPPKNDPKMTFVSPFVRSEQVAPSGPINITRSAFIETVVLKVLEHNQGWELQGLFNPLLVGPIFRQYSKPWENIAKDFIFKILTSVEDYLAVTLSDISDRDVEMRLQEFVFEDAMRSRKEAVELKLQELLVPFRKRPPATRNRLLGSRVKQLKARRAEQAESVDTDAETPKIAAGEELLDWMLAHYRIARDVFVDNVIALAVESCLLGDLEDVLSTDRVEDMTPEDVDRLVGESEETRRKRSFETERLKLLSAALEICKRHDKRYSRLPRSSLSPPATDHPNLASGNMQARDQSKVDFQDKSGSVNDWLKPPSPNPTQGGHRRNRSDDHARSASDAAASSESRPSTARNIFNAEPPASQGPQLLSFSGQSYMFPNLPTPLSQFRPPSAKASGSTSPSTNTSLGSKNLPLLQKDSPSSSSRTPRVRIPNLGPMRDEQTTSTSPAAAQSTQGKSLFAHASVENTFSSAGPGMTQDRQ